MNSAPGQHPSAPIPADGAGLSPEQLAAYQQQAAQYAADTAALQQQLQAAQQAQQAGEQHSRPDTPEQAAANRAYEQQVQNVKQTDWAAAGREQARRAVADDRDSIVAKLPKWGLSLMGIGVLLAVWNTINAMPVIDRLGFVDAYFLVESPVHAIQAYGSIAGLVGGAALLITGLVLKRGK